MTFNELFTIIKEIVDSITATTKNTIKTFFFTFFPPLLLIL